MRERPVTARQRPIMELTKEQHDIINSTGNIKINAVAGSGKTTTVIGTPKPDQRQVRYSTLLLTNQ